MHTTETLLGVSFETCLRCHEDVLMGSRCYVLLRRRHNVQGSLPKYFKNMPCFEKIMKFQVKSYLTGNIQKKKKKKRKKERKKKFFHTNKQNIQKILTSKYLPLTDVKLNNIKM